MSGDDGRQWTGESGQDGSEWNQSQPPPYPAEPRPIYGDVPRYGYQQQSASSQSQPSGSGGVGQGYSARPSGDGWPGQQPLPGAPGEQSYGVPPDDPHGYGSPGYDTPGYGSDTPGYGSPAYSGGPGYGPSGAGASGWPGPAAVQGSPAWSVPNYARWLRRVGASLIDFAPSIIAATVFAIGYFSWLTAIYRAALNGTTTPTPTRAVVWMSVGFLLLLASIGWQVYNRCLIAGRTGQSLGKRMLKITLLAEVTMQPIGALNAFVRDLLHILDGIAYLGYLWPLWDEKRQTFADKLMKTIVVDANQPVRTATQPSPVVPRP